MTASQETLPGSGGARPVTQRHRLWTLSADCHAIVVGACLPAIELRRLMDRLFSGRSRFDDLQLQAGVVAQCGSRNRVSEAVQRGLDTRHAAILRRFAAADGMAQVAQWWTNELEGDNVAGALWAALTAPASDDALRQSLCAEFRFWMHACAAAQADRAAELAALRGEVRTLRAEKLALQQRHAAWRAEALAERAALLDAARQLQLRLVRQEALVEQLQARSGPDRDARDAPIAVRAITTRHEAPPEAPVAATPRRHPPALIRAEAATAQVDDQAPVPAEAAAAPRAVELRARRVLCVGGRAAAVPAWRAWVERHGGCFEHHDGGIEDNAHRLDALLAAADLVVCQAGSLNHNAYAVVKAHCKRRGTPCVFVERPSLSALARAISSNAGRAEPSLAA